MPRHKRMDEALQSVVIKVISRADIFLADRAPAYILSFFTDEKLRASVLAPSLNQIKRKSLRSMAAIERCELSGQLDYRLNKLHFSECHRCCTEFK